MFARTGIAGEATNAVTAADAAAATATIRRERVMMPRQINRCCLGVRLAYRSKTPVAEHGLCFGRQLVLTSESSYVTLLEYLAKCVSPQP